jgi:uncharacterized membrane protein YuzA (DUF378 family)
MMLESFVLFLTVLGAVSFAVLGAFSICFIAGVFGAINAWWRG